MAAKPGLADIIYLARIPIGVAVLLSAVTIPLPLPIWATFITLIVRLALASYAGYLVARSGEFGLFGAAVGGAALMFAEHVLVGGVYFLATDELAAAGGIVISYLMFFWVAMLVGLLGGILGKRRIRGESAAI